ncbi:hypothetical protein GEV33_000724 [Tenebrio molitor]|uniref:PKD/REJ-like domain-containing protein n=1 Tax=Tenebrio molitor TaxID=7067 RepID=A0A8J6LKN6_TENMO|nr:hypothetical protein GEV33_000724 [Tenebrio molitor]
MNNTWLESAAAVIIVDFLSYNVNSNLFSVTKLVVERSATGYARTTLDVNSAQYLFVNNEDKVVRLVILTCFSLILLIFTVKVLSRMWKGKLLVVTDLWILVDLTIVGLSYGCFALFVHQARLVKQFLNKLETSKKNEFINYFNLFYEDGSYTLVAAFLVFVSTVRLWKLCRFATVFRVMEKTVILSTPAILVVLLGHTFILLSFIFSGYMIFGSISSDFKDIRDTLVSLMLLGLGFPDQFDFETFIDLNPILGRFYYTFYMILSTLILTVDVAIIMFYYYEAKLASEGEFTDVKRFLYKELLFYRTSVKMCLTRLKSGGYERRRRFVTPKTEEFRYANCMSLPTNTLETMRCIVVHDLKRFSLREKERVELMRQAWRCSRDSEMKEIFLAVKTEQNTIKILHNNVVAKVATAAELILRYDEKKKKRAEQRYKKVVEKQLNKLNYINQVLRTVLVVVSNIESFWCSYLLKTLILSSENQGNPTMLTEIDTVTLTSDYQTDCPYLTIKYKWTTDFKNWEEDEGLFSIEAAREGPGQYEVKLEIEITTEDTGSNVFKAKVCFLKVKVPGPEAIIEGGKVRTVKPDREFVVDGSKSIDIDKTPNESGRMVYSWSCSVLKGDVKDFCKRTVVVGSTLTVPAQYVLEEYEYRFVLKIKVEGDSDWLAETSQLVRVEKSLKSELKIICEKNCPPKTVCKRETFLRVKCVTNCQGIDESSYEWTVEGASFDYQKWTKFGRNTDKFIIKEDVLVLGVKYKMRVSLTGGRKGSAEQIIEVSPSLKIESCSVDPPKGTATETKFKVDCKYSGSGQSFEVYTVKDGKSVPLVKTRKLEDLEFLLPANVEAFIKIEDQDGLSDIHKLNVQVTPAITPESNQTQEISRLTDTVKDLVRKDNIGMAIQVAMGLIEELDKRPVEEAKEIKRELLKEFVDAPIKSREEARQIYSLVTRLVHDPSAESDPYQGEMATRACRKGAEIDYSYLQNEYYQNMAKEIQDNAKILMSCGSTDTKENLKQFDKKRLKFTVTTPFPVLALPKIDEHYSDYDTDDIAADKRKKYEEASQNYVEICRTTLKMMALTVVEGEDTIVASSDVVSAQITRVVGKNLVGKEIKIQGALFRASKDLERVDDAIDDESSRLMWSW